MFSGDYIGNATDEEVALSNLSQCCQQLQHIAQPVLFHYVKQRLHAPVYRGPDDTPHNLNLGSLVRLAAENPRLASNILWFDYEDVSTVAYISDTDAQDYEIIASKIGLSLPPMWRTFENETDAVLLALLLQLLPNLERLHVVLYADWAHEGLIEMPEGMRPVANIRELSLAHDDTEYGFGLGEQHALIAPLSGLTSLKTHMCVGAGAHVAFANLTRVELTYTMLTYDDLQGLLLNCKKLESFTYESGALSQDNDEEEVLPAEIVAALRPAKKSLRHLAIDWVSSYRAEYAQDSYDESAMITELPFPKLETAVLTQNTIYLPSDDPEDSSSVSLVDLWPKSIESIKFDFVRSIPHEHVIQLSEAAAAGEFPNLRHISLNTTTFAGKFQVLWKEDDYKVLRTKFEEAGISFDLNGSLFISDQAS